MTAGTDVPRPFGLWTDTPRGDKDRDRHPALLALWFSKPLVPTVRKHAPDFAELAGKHRVMNT